MNKNDLPPSYDEVIAQEMSQAGTANGSSSTVPPVPQRPGQAPPPVPNRFNAQPYSSSSSVSSSHTTTTTTSATISGGPNASSPVRRIPWVYPAGYRCSKCNNTGYKKNGKSCKSCWGKFGVQNNRVQVIPGAPMGPGYTYGSNPGFMPGAGSMFGGSNPTFTISAGPPQNFNSNLPPKIVKPGDPSLGGVLCGRCRGSGLTHFFLDQEIW